MTKPCSQTVEMPSEVLGVPHSQSSPLALSSGCGDRYMGAIGAGGC